MGCNEKGNLLQFSILCLSVTNLVAVDSALWQQPFVLNISQAGAATIYLDGKPIYDFGDDGSKQRKEQSSRYRDYAVFSFDRKPEHVIAIRYANFSTKARAS